MKGFGRLLAWALLMVVLGVVPFAIGWSGMPDPVAIHWGADGQASGAAPVGLAWLLPLIIVGIGLLTSSFLRVGGKPSAEAVAVIGAMGGVGIWISTSVVVLNFGAETWEDAGAFDLWQVLAVMVSGAVFGWLGWSLGKRWYPPTRTQPDTDVPIMELTQEERAIWAGQVRVWWPFLLLGPFAVVFLFLPGWLKVLAPLYLVLAYLFSQVSVLVDGGGLRVRLAGVLDAKRIPIDKVVTARPIDLEPAQWAGWGYRVIPGGSAVVLRRGDAIEVLMSNDRRFAVTVDDAATGAALLNGLVKRNDRS